jgi:hypothetical protein
MDGAAPGHANWGSSKELGLALLLRRTSTLAGAGGVLVSFRSGSVEGSRGPIDALNRSKRRREPRTAESSDQTAHVGERLGDSLRGGCAGS